MPDIDLETINTLASTPAVTSADTLQELEAQTSDRGLRKAIRKALYTLSQRGVVPSRKPSAAISTAPRPNIHAYSSAYDGAGNRMVILHFLDDTGGASTFALVLVNDIAGPVTFSTFKVARKELAAYLAKLTGGANTGLAIAQIDPDYARYVIAVGRKRIAANKSKLPDDMLAWMPRIGDPTAEHVPGIYAHMQNWPENWHHNTDANPQSVFGTVWFDPWFLDATDTVPWLQRWEQLISPNSTLDVDAAANLRNELIADAINGLITPDVRKQYTERLEESADVMVRCGNHEVAQQLMLHAGAMHSEQLSTEVPFLRELVNRSLTAGVEMIWLRQKQSEEQDGSEG